MGPLAVEIGLLSSSPSIWGWLHIYLFSPEIMEYDRLIGVKTRQIFSWGDVPNYWCITICLLFLLISQQLYVPIASLLNSWQFFWPQTSSPIQSSLYWQLPPPHLQGYFVVQQRECPLIPSQTKIKEMNWWSPRCHKLQNIFARFKLN